MAILKHVDFEVADWGELSSGPRLKRGYVSEVLADAPLGYWRLSETNGTQAVNSGSLGATAAGEYVGSCVLGGAGLLQRLADPAAVLGSSSRGYVAVPHASALAQNVFTFETWLRPQQNNNGPIAGKTSGGLGNGWWIWRTSSHVRFQMPGTLDRYHYASVTSGTTCFVALSYDGAAARCYFNGQPVGTISAAFTANVTDPLTLAYRRPADSWPGPLVLAHAAYYGSVLPAGRILSHYRAGIGQ